MLRNPVAHRSGVGGVTYQRLGGPTQSRITLTNDQATALEQAAHQHGDAPIEWGLDEPDSWNRPLDRLRFVHALVPHIISLVDDLVAALADDVGAPAADLPTGKMAGDIWTLALLGGLSGRVRTNGPDRPLA